MEELALFARRFENGYDLQHDERYNLWLSQKDGNGPLARKTVQSAGCLERQ
jgi:hypothetical protein